MGGSSVIRLRSSSRYVVELVDGDDGVCVGVGGGVVVVWAAQL
jgi:hypothetical protein